jgi:hypothetical protein
MYVFMRTTLDVPDELYHAAKIEAAKRRTTMRELLICGLKHSLGQSSFERNPGEKNKRFLEGLEARNDEAISPLTRDEIYAERLS